MPVIRLATVRVEKPWGRRTLDAGFADQKPGEPPIGEIWFEAPPSFDPELLIKYLFTSEKLSVQNHPSDEEAHKRGLPRGKDECWTVLAAEPDSTIAIGPLETMTKEELRESAEDGSLEHKLDWKSVKAGDFFYSRSGVIHAIGAGLTIIEVQQNSDTTFRLFDYGRPRELHLDDGVAVAELTPYAAPIYPGEVEPGRRLLVEGPTFVLERLGGGDRLLRPPEGKRGWLVPIGGSGTIGGQPWTAGECLMIEGPELMCAPADADVIFTYAGSQRA